MRIFRVGGAVRDALLGLPVRDEDWVVVGTTPEAMIAAGYLPVGKDFPVFLHPETREEYALARTERKSGQGYHGFAFHASPSVTLEQDLARRDLTINAIAQAADGALIDPFGGQRDLQRKVLRHVTDAFGEDPVRILRVARFAARFADFSVAPETLAMMRAMVEHGEADHLVAERVWQELARGLMEDAPSRMFEVLRDCGALQRVLPELAADAHAMAVLDIAAHRAAPLPVRFAAITANQAGPGGSERLKAFCNRLRVPNDCRELADVVLREQAHVHGSEALDALGLVRLLERCDAFRKPERFELVLLACECDARARSGDDADYPPRERLLLALAAARAVDTARVAQQAHQQGLAGEGIGERIQQARARAVGEALGA